MLARWRLWLAAAAVGAVLFEIASSVLLVPWTTFTISLDVVYSTISLPIVMAMAAVAGALSLAISGAAIYYLGAHPGRWQIANSVLLAVGSMATLFLAANIAISFGNLALDDAYPAGFAFGPNWGFAMNLPGPVILFAWLVSAFLRFAMSPDWRSPSVVKAIAVESSNKERE